MDRIEVLKRLAGINKDVGGDDSFNILNDSMLDVLKQNCGLGVEAKKVRNSKGKKITTGKQIAAEDISEAGGESRASGVASKNGNSRGE